jgi:hypothetical protein
MTDTHQGASGERKLSNSVTRIPANQHMPSCAYNSGHPCDCEASVIASAPSGAAQPEPPRGEQERLHELLVNFRYQSSTGRGERGLKPHHIAALESVLIPFIAELYGELVARIYSKAGAAASGGANGPQAQEWNRQESCSECDGDGCANCEPAVAPSLKESAQKYHDVLVEITNCQKIVDGEISTDMVKACLILKRLFAAHSPVEDEPDAFELIDVFANSDKVKLRVTALKESAEPGCPKCGNLGFSVIGRRGKCLFIECGFSSDWREFYPGATASPSAPAQTDAFAPLRQLLEPFRELNAILPPAPWIRWVSHSDVYCDLHGENSPALIEASHVLSVEADDLPDIPAWGDDEDQYQIWAEQIADGVVSLRNLLPELLRLAESAPLAVPAQTQDDVRPIVPRLGLYQKRGGVCFAHGPHPNEFQCPHPFEECVKILTSEGRWYDANGNRLEKPDRSSLYPQSRSVPAQNASREEQK